MWSKTTAEWICFLWIVLRLMLIRGSVGGDGLKLKMTGYDGHTGDKIDELVLEGEAFGVLEISLLVYKRWVKKGYGRVVVEVLP